MFPHLAKIFNSSVRYNSSKASSTLLLNTGGATNHINSLLPNVQQAEKETANNDTGASYALVLQGWKPLHENRFIRPHELVQKNRKKPMYKFRTRPRMVGPKDAEARWQDPFYQLGINPLSQTLNAPLLANFVSEMGKIKGRAETGLTLKSQRQLTKAIKRAKMMGIIPVLSKWKPKEWNAYDNVRARRVGTA